jgi:hypothetical protein
MKFAKDSRHECSINVMQVKGVTRAITGGERQDINDYDIGVTAASAGHVMMSAVHRVSKRTLHAASIGIMCAAEVS